MAEKKNKKLEEREEREYIIPLRSGWSRVPRYKRANKAIKTIKEFLARHMKLRDRDLKKVKLEGYINDFVWTRGIKKPPIKIKVKVFRDGNVIRAELSDLPPKLRFKKEKMEKIKEKAEKVMEKKKDEQKEDQEDKKNKDKKPDRTEEDEKKEKEKIIAVEESMKKIEKEAARKEKHMLKGKVKEPKHQRRMALQK